MLDLDYKLNPWAHQLRCEELSSRLPDVAFLMDMGTGKTGATVNCLRRKFKQHKRVLRTLILCPVGVCRSWEKEFKNHATDYIFERVHILDGSAKDRLAKAALAITAQPYSIFVTSYEALVRDDLQKFFMQWKPEIIIADESQRIKNPQAKTTVAATALADLASYKFILTGTPMTNSLMDIYAQYRFLDRGETFGTKFFGFRNKYFEDKNRGMPSDRHFPKWVPKPGTEEKFNELIYKKAIRVMKSECMDLPPFIREKIEVEMSEPQRKAYEEMERDFITYLGDSACVANLALTKHLRMMEILAGFAKLDDGTVSRFVNPPRIRTLIETVEALPKDAKVVIWTSFVETYDMIEKALAKAKFKSTKLVGGMSPKARADSLHAFRTNPKIKAMIANQASAGVGVDGMQVANYEIYYGKTFNLEHDLQSNDRIYRGGSEVHEKVTRIDLVCPGTLDETVNEALARKLSEAEAVLVFRKAYGLDGKKK